MKKIHKLTLASSAALLATPLVTFAQDAGDIGDGLIGVVGVVSDLVGAIVPVILALALAFFLWGVLQLAFSKDEGNRKQARDLMLWGIIALFIMTAVWAFVRLLQNTLFNETDYVTPPQLPGVPGINT